MTRIRTFQHGNPQQALIEAALDLLDTEGSVTIRAVAEKTGVSPARPANHLKDRKALLTGVAKAEFESIWQQIDSGLASSTRYSRKVIRDSRIT